MNERTPRVTNKMGCFWRRKRKEVGKVVSKQYVKYSELFKDDNWILSDDFKDKELIQVEKILKGYYRGDAYNHFIEQDLELFNASIQGMSREDIHYTARRILSVKITEEDVERISYLKVIVDKIGSFESNVFAMRNVLETDIFTYELIKFARDNGADLAHLFSRYENINDMRKLRDMGASVFSKVHPVNSGQVCFGFTLRYCTRNYRFYSEKPGNQISLVEFADKFHGDNKDYIEIIKEEYGVVKIQNMFRTYLAIKEANIRRCYPVNLFDEKFGNMRKNFLGVHKAWFE